jgi:hypothetical protein
LALSCTALLALWMDIELPKAILNLMNNVPARIKQAPATNLQMVAEGLHYSQQQDFRVAAHRRPLLGGHWYQTRSTIQYSSLLRWLPTLR